MRKQDAFSRATRNPYAARFKRQVTIRLDEPTIRSFKQLAEETGVRCQTLINLSLRDRAASGRELALTWKPAAESGARCGAVVPGESTLRPTDLIFRGLSLTPVSQARRESAGFAAMAAMATPSMVNVHARADRPGDTTP